jgi:triphosphoribosyl-dephospho-CoA synthase
MMPLLLDTARISTRADSRHIAEARRMARLARQALIAEAELTPKPGLVDRRGSGAHTDLSLDLLRRSAVAIEPYFYKMAVVSQGGYPSQAIRERLALIGRQAERAMLEATNGSNSHKGAIWALGLLVSALAMHDRSTATASAGVGTAKGTVPASAIVGTARDTVAASVIAIAAAEIVSFEDRAVPRLVSHGDAVVRRHGVAGARGEARSGFPHVMNVVLPMLRRRRQNGATEEVARLDALLSAMSRLDDTCVLYRGDEEALAMVKEGALAVERAGGAGTAAGARQLQALDRRMLELNVSPGGSADLLAAALFLDAVEYGQDDVQADRSLSEEVSHGAH